MSLTFEGTAWDDGTSMVSLNAGFNLVGLPVDDLRVNNVYDIITVAAGAVVASSLFPLTMDLDWSELAGDAANGPCHG